ncbi:MAG: Rap1a/Tai family immunity protein [Gammaproteobacteria bacterium]|jgi:hypothetical protein
MRKLYGVVVALVPALILALTPSPAAAQGTDMTIAKVRAYCAEWEKTDFATVDDPFLAGYCLGLIQGFRDGATVGMASTISFFKEKVTYSGPERRTGYERWCFPEGVTNQQLAGAFMSWSSDKQAYWHLPYSIAFYEAFREEWPCGPDGGSVAPKIEEAPPAPKMTPMPGK